VDVPGTPSASNAAEAGSARRSLGLEAIARLVGSRDSDADRFAGAERRRSTEREREAGDGENDVA
jgi:hypothetical protein